MPTTAPDSTRLSADATNPHRVWLVLGLLAAALATAPAYLAHEKIQALRYAVCRCGGATPGHQGLPGWLEQLGSFSAGSPEQSVAGAVFLAGWLVVFGVGLRLTRR